MLTECKSSIKNRTKCISIALLLGTVNMTHAAEVCSVFDGNAIGSTHTLRFDGADITDDATNQDLFGKNDVYFGGSLPTAANPSGIYGVSAAVIESNTTYDLTTLGKITVKGTFYNRDYATPGQYNESYVGLLPADLSSSSLTNPVIGTDAGDLPPHVQRLGLYSGISLLLPGPRILVVESGSATTTGGGAIVNATPVAGTPTASSIPPMGQWFDLSATYEIVAGNFQMTDMLIDGVSASTIPGASYTFPVIYGPVANFPWLNSMKTFIAADDATSEMCVDNYRGAAAVPTLSQWALIFLSGLMLLTGVFFRPSKNRP